MVRERPPLAALFQEMRRRCRRAKTPTGSRSSTPSGSFAASCPSTALFPPGGKTAFHEAVLSEILQERVVSSRWRRNPRGAKRKMSNLPLRPRRACPKVRIKVAKCIRIVK